MDTDFWISRWKEKQIGFHQKNINEHLIKLWSKTKLSDGAHILVPLCGKSKDMIWLCERGNSVTGVEVSEIALKEFCEEQCIEPHVHNDNGYIYCRVRPDFNLICSDLFKITNDKIGKVDAVYDRASIVALPEKMRKSYATHLDSLLEKGAKIFMITFEYDQSKMQGPPFSVSEKEVNQLFSENFIIEHLETVNATTLANRINSPVEEKIYLLTKK